LGQKNNPLTERTSDIKVFVQFATQRIEDADAKACFLKLSGVPQPVNIVIG